MRWQCHHDIRKYELNIASESIFRVADFFLNDLRVKKILLQFLELSVLIFFHILDHIFWYNIIWYNMIKYSAYDSYPMWQKPEQKWRVGWGSPQLEELHFQNLWWARDVLEIWFSKFIGWNLRIGWFSTYRQFLLGSPALDTVQGEALSLVDFLVISLLLVISYNL